MTKIAVGHRAILRSEHGSAVLTFDIVENESEAESTAILASSEIGQTLIGKQVDDRIELDAAGGKASYVITDIEDIRAS